MLDLCHSKFNKSRTDPGRETTALNLFTTYFFTEGLKDVSIDPLNNVFGRLPGREKTTINNIGAPRYGIPRSTNLHFTREEDRIYGPGIEITSLGVAALFGLLWLLRDRKINLQGDIWFTAM